MDPKEWAKWRGGKRRAPKKRHPDVEHVKISPSGRSGMSGRAAASRAFLCDDELSVSRGVAANGWISTISRTSTFVRERHPARRRAFFSGLGTNGRTSFACRTRRRYSRRNWDGMAWMDGMGGWMDRGPCPCILVSSARSSTRRRLELLPRHFVPIHLPPVQLPDWVSFPCPYRGNARECGRHWPVMDLGENVDFSEFPLAGLFPRPASVG